MCVLIHPHPHQHLLLSVFHIVAILLDVKCFLEICPLLFFTARLHTDHHNFERYHAMDSHKTNVLSDQMLLLPNSTKGTQHQVTLSAPWSTGLPLAIAGGGCREWRRRRQLCLTASLAVAIETIVATSSPF